MRTDRGLLLEIALAAPPRDFWQEDGTDPGLEDEASTALGDYENDPSWASMVVAQAMAVAASADSDGLRANLLALAGSCLAWLRDIDFSEGVDAA